MDVYNAIMAMTAEQRAAIFAHLSSAVAAAPAPAPAPAAPAPAPDAPAEEKKKAPKKATTTKSKAPEDPLLAPPDAVPGAPAPAAPAPAPASAADAADPLRNHKYRLQEINHDLCMGRKIDEDNPIVGTRKGDDGANGMFWPEKQCSKKPLPGQKLCKICAEKDNDVKAGKPAHKQWYGRLDEPLYANAKVIGCKHFFEKYPHGLKNDPTTAPGAAPAPAAAAPAPAPAAAPAPAPAEEKPKAKTTKVKAKKSAEPASAPAPVTESVANTSAPATEAEWVAFFHGGKSLARNTKTGKVYVADLTKGDSVEETVQRDKCVGAWVNGAIDPTGAVDSDDEE